MTAGALVIELHKQGGDTNLILDGWIKLSDEKGYPKTEEGLRRYLSRIKSGQGNLPKRKLEDERKRVTNPVPEEFIKWWEQHPEGKKDAGGPQARVAFDCQRYRDEWNKHKASEANDAPF
jgi:hypothetical protein